MFCPKCSISNVVSAKFCSACGYALSPSGHTGTAPQTETKAPSASEEFYKAAIGPKNQDYYLDKFLRFDRAGKAGASWHWPAFFLTFYWFLYRKMWLNAAIYFVLPYVALVLLGIVGAMAGRGADAIVGFAYVIYLASIFFLPPVYANALYYRHCRHKIAEVRASSSDRQRQLGELSAKGGTSHVVLIIVLVLGFVAVIGILAAIAIPTYHDYTIRARVLEGASLGNRAAESVANHVYQHREMPRSLEAAGFVATLPPSVKEIAMNSQNGVVVVTMAVAPIVDKSLLLVPSLDADNRIAWQCTSEDIPDRYLPRDCKVGQSH